jgi:prevent-host-death family protein
LIQQVNEDRAPVEITSRTDRGVLISADEWEAWQEAAYLFRSPAKVCGVNSTPLSERHLLPTGMGGPPALVVR